MMSDLIEAVLPKIKSLGNRIVLDRDYLRLNHALSITGAVGWKWKRYAYHVPTSGVIVFPIEPPCFPLDLKPAWKTPIPEGA